ncbi:RloB family protein [Dactylosporangium sp. NPDC005572]|uniref:RloB family protein n=1 Tax=Dactylosporangium sp. NPDC005572 TaxID=3156889 RepID=UPI0033B71BF5
MARNRQPPTSLRRKVATRRPRKTIAICCEGQRTEPEYLDALRREPDVRDVAAVDIRIERVGGGAVPLTLVRLAVEARRRALAEEGEIDEFWCVYDVEWPTHHPGLVQAADLAARNGSRCPDDNPSSGMHRLVAAVLPVG